MSPLALSLQFLQAQPDTRLVALAREGHEPAFEALVRRYRKELLAYCRRLQPRSGSAEDALQQTFLQAWTALSAGAEIRNVRPWLYRIAHNVTLNQLRDTVSARQHVSDAVSGPEVHQLVEQRLQARAALAGMAALPTLQRDVFVSATLNGESHEEVASSLGLSSGAVRGLIYRARATLRSAAAAIIPSPALQWALRRAASRAGAPATSEMLAGGGGVGVAAAIAKGGAVLTLAVAGASGAMFTHASNHHRRPEARPAGRAPRVQGHSPMTGFAAAIDKVGTGFVLGRPRGSRSSESHASQSARATGERGRDSGSVGDAHGGSGTGFTGDRDGRSEGGSDGGSSTRSSGSSDGGSVAGAIASSSEGGGGSSSGGSSAGSDGGSGGASTSTISGSDGGTSGGGSSGDQVSLVGATSDGRTGSDGGSSSSAGTSSGSGDSTTATTSTH